KEMVTIVDPHIKVSESYPVYSSGVESNVFVKQLDYRQPEPTSKIFEGYCWPGLSAWPDFVNSKVREWWGLWFNPDDLNDNFYTWNDMNEPSVFDVPEKTMYRDLMHLGGIEHRDVHNIHGLQVLQWTIVDTATISDWHPSKANVYTASQAN
ncbi:hypothetical protein FOZ63_018187, partial [Perkinsus olseni]